MDDDDWPRAADVGSSPQTSSASNSPRRTWFRSQNRYGVTWACLIREGENMRMMQSYTPRDWALLILRVGLGITLIVHGYPKFSGAGPVAFAHYLRVHHFPAPLFSAWIMAIIEVVGCLAMVAGIQTTYVGWAAAADNAAHHLPTMKPVDGGGLLPAGTCWERDVLQLLITLDL